MILDELTALRGRLEEADALDEELARAMVSAMSDGLSGKISEDDALAEIMQSADGVIRVAGHMFPGWALGLDGYASTKKNAHWRCTLRETAGPDDDQIVGIGNAMSMRLAILAAIAHIQIMRHSGYV